MGRHLISFVLAQFVASHIASIDQISCQFFDEKIDYAKQEVSCGGELTKCCG